MPILSEPVPGPVVGIVTAGTGWRVEASAPQGSGTSGVPAPSTVVAWVLVADELAPGGATVEPVFYADGRMWTPQQFRAAYGAAIDVTVARAS